MLSELALVGDVGASFALLGSGSPLGLSPVVVLVLGGGITVEAAVSTELFVSAGAFVEGAELTLDSPFDALEVPVLATLMPVVEWAGREVGSRLGGLEGVALATFFDGAFVALPALVPRGDALAVLRLDASSRAALWVGALSTTGAAAAALSPAPLPPATVAGGDAFESLTFEGAIGAAVFSGASMVRSSTSAPPITVAVITPRARPK